MTSTMFKKSIATTSLVLCGALAMFVASCASSDTQPPTSTDTGTGTGTSTGGSGGGGADSVTFATGKAATGPMSGYGWVALGRDDKLSAPNCGGTEITSTAPCTTSTTWPSSDALCITGSMPVVTNSDYNNNWGIQIGVNASETELEPIGDKGYQTITLTFTGAPSPVGAAMRAELHRSTDGTNTQTYCHDVVSGTPIKLTDFNTKCWGEAGTVKLETADIKNIDKVGLQICTDTSNAYTLTNICLTGISFGK
jgi:hypothetical protein